MRAVADTVTRARARVLAIAWVVVAIGIAAVAVGTLPEPLYGYLFALPAHRYAEVLPDTVAAAVRVWGFWGLFGAVLGAVLLRVDASLSWVDALLGGTLGFWVLAFFAGNVLGPLGLVHAWTVWGVLVAVAAALVMVGWPRRRPERMTAGHWLVLLAGGLVGPGLLAIQLGAPVPPFMDVLATPASAQRVLTFATYVPLDSDPYGYWDAGSQCPATELLYAFLAVGGGVPFAVLAQTAAIVPLAGLLLLAVYRLGAAVGDDCVGGFAAIFLVATVFFRVLPYAHGRIVAYVLVAAGLAWFVESPGSRVRRVLGALVLGTAVAAHAVVGALGMGVAALTLVLQALDAGWRKTVAGFGVLLGASLFAAPELVVGLRLAVPFPWLPIVQAAGVLIAAGAAGAASDVDRRRRLATRVLRWGLTAFVLWTWVQHPPLIGGLQDHQIRFPLLFVVAGLGLGTALWGDVRGRSSILLAPVVAALLLGAFAEKLSAEWWSTFADPRVQIAVQGFFRKIDYWYPFVWVLPAGWLLAAIARRTSPGFAALIALAALFHPWGPDDDPNSHQQSIAEAWAQQSALARGGYWGETGDRRWAQTPAERALVVRLQEEVRAGRITFATHVVHVEPSVVLYEDVVLFSVFTGIDDDTYVAGRWTPDKSNVGGRVLPRRELDAALQRRPPYVVVHEQQTRRGRHVPVETIDLLARALAGYEEIFAEDGVRLLRRPDLRPAG